MNPTKKQYYMRLSDKPTLYFSTDGFILHECGICEDKPIFSVFICNCHDLVKVPKKRAIEMIRFLEQL